MLFLFCSCSNEKKENIKLSIFQYPDRIVYIKDIDDCLDLKGGVLEFTKESGFSYFVRMDYFFEDSGVQILELRTDIDYHKEGNYTVTFSYEGVSVSFPVIVIDQNYIKDRTPESE
jgi:hypothetical protein